MRKQNIGKIAGLAMAAAIGIGVSTSAFAALTPLTLTVGAGGSLGDHILGEVLPSYNPGSGLAVRDLAMLGTLLGMDPGERTFGSVTPNQSNPDYYRSTTDYGTLPLAINDALHPALLAGSIGVMDTTSFPGYISIKLPETMTYQYLVGAYDGRNSGAEVWYIGNVAAGTQILIPRAANPDQDGLNLVAGTARDITSWTMFNPTPVPEPTTMIAGALLLLPFGASTLRALRRNRAA